MDGRFFWQRTWETEVGTTFQSNFETVTKNYVVDYLSIANRDILVTEDGSFTQRYVYDENSTRISAEYGYAAGTKRGEGGENLQSDFAANDVRKVWYRASHLGSTLFAVGENGKVISHTIYDPWGNPLTETYTDTNSSGIDNANNYTGYTWDEVLDLYFAQNRFYDPADHRFTQEDHIKDGENWYRYCGNEPVNSTDPDGYSSKYRYVHVNGAQIRSSANDTLNNVKFTVNKNTMVIYEGNYVYVNGEKWARVKHTEYWGWIKANHLGNEPIGLTPAQIQAPANYLPSNPGMVRYKSDSYRLYVPAIKNGSNTDMAPAQYTFYSKEDTSWNETNWAAVGMTELESGADVGDVLPSGSAPSMFALMGLQLANSALKNTVTIKLHARMYKHALFENQMVLKLGFRIERQREYAGSYFYYADCYPETGTFSRRFVQEQIANGFGYRDHKYADIKVSVDKQRATQDDQFYITTVNGQMKAFPIKGAGDSMTVVYQSPNYNWRYHNQWLTGASLNDQYKRAYTVPDKLKSKIISYAQTDMSITGL